MCAKLAWRIEKRGSSASVRRCFAPRPPRGSLSKAISRPSRRQPREQQRASGRRGRRCRRRRCRRASVDERVDRFVQQDGRCAAMAMPWRASEDEVLERHRASRAASTAASWRRSARASQSSKWLPMPSSITSRISPAAARSSGEISTRDEASISTSIALPRKMRFQPLESMGSAASGRGTSPTPAAGRQQAAIGMLGEGELVDSHRRQQLAVARRHRDPALAVQRQRRGTLKHDARHKIPQKCTLRHFSRALAQGQLTNETKINGIKDLVATPRAVAEANKCPKKQGLAAPTERRSSPVRGRMGFIEGKRGRTCSPSARTASRISA